jgi:hypothetical protein
MGASRRRREQDVSITHPTRIDHDLYESAKARPGSAAERINMWARIGRELEASPGVSQRDIARVLAGDGSYDDLSEREQAVVRAVWSERIVTRREALNYEDQFLAAGESWSEADEHGNLVVRNP